MSGQNLDNDIKVAIARGIHLFPFRTEKLSLVTPMVLRNSGRVGSRRLEKGESRKREESVERLAPFSVIYTSRCRDVVCLAHYRLIVLLLLLGDETQHAASLQLGEISLFAESGTIKFVSCRYIKNSPNDSDL